MAGQIYTFDDDEALQPAAVERAPVAPPPAEESAKRKPGRPRGARTTTTKDDGRLNTADFAFLRAMILGIEPKDAAARYLTSRDRMDQQNAVAYERRVRRSIIALVNAIPPETKDFATIHDRTRAALNRLTAPTGKPSIKVSVTYEEFAARYDEDWSEREIRDEYEAQYGKEVSASDDPYEKARKDYEDSRSNAVAAINWLSMRLAARPEGDQSCFLWLEDSLAIVLSQKGIHTLGELATWINARGRRWYEAVTNVGRTRAHRLVSFLVENEADIGVEISTHVRAGHERTPSQDGREPGAGSDIVIRSLDHPVPFDQLDWPPTLRGDDGFYRNTPGANDYGVENDPEAVKKWLKSLQRKSVATQDTYYRAVERFVLWAILIRKKALSSLDENDFHQFEQFLRNPPGDWTSPAKAQKWSKEWRPFRGPLAQSSIMLNMRVLSSMYSTWNNKGYLRTNPVPKLEATASVRADPDEAGMAAQLNTQSQGIDPSRSFTDRDLAFIRGHFMRLPEGVEKNRLRAIILLLQTSGLRRSEATSLNWGNLRSMDFGHRSTGELKITVLGKGSKVREVPLHPDVLQALEVHYQDRAALIQAGKLHCGGLRREDTPLLSILDERLTVSPGRDGHAPEDAMRTGNKTGRLSTGRLYKILKEFFAAVSRNKNMDSMTAAKFRRASTHWLRHTFAHQALQASKNDLSVVQALLGHADIGTTGVYTAADLEQRAHVVKQISSSLP